MSVTRAIADFARDLAAEHLLADKVEIALSPSVFQTLAMEIVQFTRFASTYRAEASLGGEKQEVVLHVAGCAVTVREAK